MGYLYLNCQWSKGLAWT